MPQMSRLEGSIEQLRARAGNKFVSDAIQDILTPGAKYGMVPLVHEDMRDPIVGKLERVTGIMVVTAFSRNNAVGISAGIIPPKDQSKEVFSGHAVGLLDGLKSKQPYNIKLNEYVADLASRDVKALGAVALFEGDEAAAMVLAFPNVLVNDLNLPYAQGLVDSKPCQAGSTPLKRASVALTSGVLCALFAGSTSQQ